MNMIKMSIQLLQFPSYFVCFSLLKMFLQIELFPGTVIRKFQFLFQACYFHTTFFFYHLRHILHIFLKCEIKISDI